MLPLFIALDLDNEDEALKLAQKCRGLVMGFKVGPRLYFRSNPELLKKLSEFGKVFLDFKFYDIPSTMEASVRSAFEQGAGFVTVHGSADEAALKRVHGVEREFQNGAGKKRVLAVSVLTSSSGPERLSRVLKLAEKVHQAGLSSFVAGAGEVSAIKKQHPDFFIVTPGIRLAAIEKEDQAQIFSPKKALEMGSSALVMGRPILEAGDPVHFLGKIKAHIEGA